MAGIQGSMKLYSVEMLSNHTILWNQNKLEKY